VGSQRPGKREQTVGTATRTSRPCGFPVAHEAMRRTPAHPPLPPRSATRRQTSLSAAALKMLSYVTARETSVELSTGGTTSSTWTRRRPDAEVMGVMVVDVGVGAAGVRRPASPSAPLGRKNWVERAAEASPAAIRVHATARRAAISSRTSTVRLARGCQDGGVKGRFWGVDGLTLARRARNARE
jgi:hypothetical protein